ncbi:pleckstrin homology domain-containing family A member 4-like [Rhinatrema bivittatum]|uniref:pleckstrin homology domain-containing family A member 4-like n=1 Tax=Rhinatrema bivittatum TaxID=194408 RepID=UPI00112C5996|nr:pleckstrin homology domain-containing family A member 4-like [Rhinatrema bivittatum]
MPRLHQKARGSLGRCQAASCEELSLIDSPTLGGRRLARPHTPVGRVDILPDSELALSPSNPPQSPRQGASQLMDPGIGASLEGPTLGPKLRQTDTTFLPSDDPLLALARPTGHLAGSPRGLRSWEWLKQERRQEWMERVCPIGRHRAANNSCRSLITYPPRQSLPVTIPPLPSGFQPPHFKPDAGKRLSLAALAAGSGSYKDRMLQLGRRTESEMDALLTRLCGQDKLLLSLEGDWSQLQVEKETLENTLDLTRLRLEELQDQEPTEKVRRQQRLLQDDLVRVRARLCDLAPEMEGAWQEYRVLENELHDQRYALEHLHRTGHPQEQAAAQRDLWMIDDIVSGLRANKNNFPGVHEFARHPPIFFPASPAHEEPFVLSEGLVHLSELELPGPKKKPRGLAEAHSTDEPTVVALEAGGVHFLEHSWALSTGGDSPNTSSQGSASVCVQRETCSPVSSAVSPQGEGDPEAKASPPARGRRQRMSAEEQLERMRRPPRGPDPGAPNPPGGERCLQGARQVTASQQSQPPASRVQWCPAGAADDRVHRMPRSQLW